MMVAPKVAELTGLNVFGVGVMYGMSGQSVVSWAPYILFCSVHRSAHGFLITSLLLVVIRYQTDLVCVRSKLTWVVTQLEEAAYTAIPHILVWGIALLVGCMGYGSIGGLYGV